MHEDEIKSFTDNANAARNETLTRLLKDAMITDDQYDQYEEYTTKWQMIVVKCSWFQKWEKVFNKGKDKIDGYMIKYVKFED